MLRALRRSVAIRALLRNASHSAGPPQNKKDTKTVSFLFGGDKRDRTADLLTASQALSQLSYTPKPNIDIIAMCFLLVNYCFAFREGNVCYQKIPAGVLAFYGHF